MKKIMLGFLLFFALGTATGQDIAKLKITDIEKYIANGNGDILVINFWATFCKPCVAEIPFFISTVEKYKSQKVKLILVSLDMPSYYPARIASFAKKHKFNSNIVWLDESNADYFCPKIDSAWSGSIPATLIINTATGSRKFAEEEMTPESLEMAIKEVISK